MIYTALSARFSCPLPTSYNAVTGDFCHECVDSFSYIYYICRYKREFSSKNFTFEVEKKKQEVLARQNHFCNDKMQPPVFCRNKYLQQQTSGLEALTLQVAFEVANVLQCLQLGKKGRVTSVENCVFRLV